MPGLCPGIKRSKIAYEERQVTDAKPVPMNLTSTYFSKQRLGFAPRLQVINQLLAN